MSFYYETCFAPSAHFPLYHLLMYSQHKLFYVVSRPPLQPVVHLRQCSFTGLQVHKQPTTLSGNPRISHFVSKVKYGRVTTGAEEGEKPVV